MLIVMVHVHVKAERVQDFIEATKKNGESSVKEPGIAGFDVIQQMDDPKKFILVEVYKNVEAPGKHKETLHYKIWRDSVESMMDEPRKSYKYSNIFPDDPGWK